MIVMTTQPTTHTLDVPGATLTYDVRRNESRHEPVLVPIGYGQTGDPDAFAAKLRQVLESQAA